MNPKLRLLLLLGMVAPRPAQALPRDIVSMLPAHYHVLSSADIRPASRTHFYIVAIARDGEAGFRDDANAPPRPLLIFKAVGEKSRLAGRNDVVVLRADEGGQCDPFTDAEQPIATKGRYFTVENGVACGSHWTDYITFRFDDASDGFVFDNERRESWSLNPSSDPNADALVRDGPQTVHRRSPGRAVPFSAWQPIR